MGPYYRGTSQGMGAFFDTFYQHPFLMVLFLIAAIGAGLFIWYRKRSFEK